MLRRPHWGVILVLLVTLMGGLPACLFKKKKPATPPVAPAGPIRVVFLPANLAADDSENRWMALAVPVLLTKSATVSPDLEPVPLWQVLPIAVENAGASRTINPELASYLASRMGARWGAMGEIIPSKEGFTVLIDFIPVKASAYAFRYQKTAPASSLESNLRQAIDGFLDYQLAKPVVSKQSKAAMDASLLRRIAETLDNDCGWFTAPAPGQGEAVAAGLVRSDSKLAPLILNPTLYPVVGSLPAPASPSVRPVPQMPPPPAESENPPGTTLNESAPASPAPPALPPPAIAQAQPEALVAVEVPPPKTFTLRVGRPPAANPGTAPDTPSSGAPRGSPAYARAGPPPASSPADAASSAGTPPPKNPPKPSKSVIPQKSQASTFRVQICSLRVRASAEAEAARLATSDLAVSIEEADLGPKGIWYRVFLTGFESRAKAIRAARKLKAEGLIQDFIPVP